MTRAPNPANLTVSDAANAWHTRPAAIDSASTDCPP